MQAAMGFDDLDPGAQPEVKGIAEDDLGTQIDQFVGRDPFHRTNRADRHEYRGVDGAVGSFEHAATGMAFGMGNAELHGETLR